MFSDEKQRNSPPKKVNFPNLNTTANGQFHVLKKSGSCIMTLCLGGKGCMNNFANSHKLEETAAFLK
jgi:hypothetical protein